MIVTKNGYKDLEKFYTYVYKCNKCKKKYGSDYIENQKKCLCPLCDDRYSRAWHKRKTKSIKTIKSKVSPSIKAHIVPFPSAAVIAKFINAQKELSLSRRGKDLNTRKPILKRKKSNKVIR